MSSGGNYYGRNQLLDAGPPGPILQPDPHLSRSLVAIAVFAGLIFLALVLFLALFLGRFWPLPGRTATCTSTADQTTVALALRVANATASDCPFADYNCSTATAQETAYGNLTLQSDTALVVGFYTSACTTIGASAETAAANDRRCDITLSLNGEGGLDAGVVTLAGLKTVADADDDDVTFPNPFAVTGGAVANYARPIGGEITLAYNASSTVLTLTGSVILVN